MSVKHVFCLDQHRLRLNHVNSDANSPSLAVPGGTIHQLSMWETSHQWLKTCGLYSLTHDGKGSLFGAGCQQLVFW